MADADTTKQSVLRTFMHGPASRFDMSPRLKIYTLFLMGVITALAVMDRNILNILLTPIKAEIGASDTAMGLLTGTAFAVFYATAAIPISRIVDVGNRRNLLAISLAIWSAATAACGLAHNYWHLLLGRIGVAAGESSANPAIMSIISDLYPPTQRAMALGVTLMGTGVGVLMGSALGGYLAEHYDWRHAFMVVGIPGLLLSLLLFWTTPEPVRGASEGGMKADPDSETLGATMRYVMRTPTFLYVVTAKTFVQLATQAQLIWAPAFLVRVHDMPLTQVGLYYGLAIAGGTIGAAIVAGLISDRLAKRGAVWYLRFGIMSNLVSAPVAAMIAMTQNGTWAVIMIFLYAFASSTNTTPSFAGALAVVRPRMRGFTVAVIYFVTNLVGAGLGGLIVGALNDALEPRFGDEAIRYSLLVMPCFLSISAVVYYFSTRTIARDVARAQQTQEGAA